MSTELQRALVGRFRSDTGVNALVAGRVYDNPPVGAVFPYISIGPDTTSPSRADCYDGDEIHQQVDAWSRKPGYQEAKQIIDAVRAAILASPLTLTGFRLVDIYFERAQTLRDPDGLTSHGILVIRALTEPE